MAHTEELFQAFVLHRRDYQDSSLLLEVFGIGQGRFPAIARGARRARAQGGVLLQPFQPLWLAAQGRGEVRTLTRVEAASAPLALNGPALLSGFYLNEILVRMLARNDAQDDLFAFYHAALVQLTQATDIEPVLRQFELQLLAELGYAVSLDVDRHGAAVCAQAHYRFHPEVGIEPVPAAADAISGTTLLTLAQGDPLDERQRLEARRLLRAMLRPHLGERPLHSRELFRAWYGKSA